MEKLRLDPWTENALTANQKRRLSRSNSKRKSQAAKSTELPKNEDFTKREPLPPLNPKTDNQRLLMEHLRKYEQVIAIGSAGTGKTFVAATMAADLFRFGKIKTLVLTRPNVATGRSIGLTPGTEIEKMQRWLAPLTEVIKSRIGAAAFEIAVKRGSIVYQPLETIRGQSFENAWVLFDEVQNATKDEILAVVTRVGENSKVIMTGDTKQTDIGNASGLKFVMDILKENKTLAGMTGIVEFTPNDIVRSGLCAAWVKAMETTKL